MQEHALNKTNDKWIDIDCVFIETTCGNPTNVACTVAQFF